MHKQQTIPIIFSVTGHRDIYSKDIPQLKTTITGIFRKYKETNPNTKLILISALAEGSDMLAAEVAMKVGVSLHIILPYQEGAYLESFHHQTSRKQYQALKEYASECTVLDCNPDIDVENCYQQVGEYIADTSNILIALWDGQETGKRGGTAAVVKYARQGFTENRFDHLNGKALIIVNTPRQSNPDVKQPFDIKEEYLGSLSKKAFLRMLGEINTLNCDIEKNITAKGTLGSFIDCFDKKAMCQQGRFSKGTLSLLILTWIAILSLEIMHNLHINHFVIGYGVSLLAAFAVYRYWMKNGAVQNNFIHSRGFAESLEVQRSWNGSGVNSCVAKYYLLNQHEKFTWMRVVLKNIFYLSKRDKKETYDFGERINGQIEYFNRKIKEKEKNLIFLERMEYGLYHIGLLTLIALFSIYLFENLNDYYHWILDFHINWHLLVLASGVLLMTAAFIGEKYAKLQGYKEDIYNYGVMLTNYKTANSLLEKTSDNSEEYCQIILDLGKKALDENSKWVVLHESRRAKLELD